MRAWASENAPSADVDSETQAFRNYERPKPASDWPMAWRSWLLKAEKFNKQRGTTRKPATRQLDFNLPQANFIDEDIPHAN